MWRRTAWAASVVLIGIGTVGTQPKVRGINWGPGRINADSVVSRTGDCVQDRRLLNLLPETEFVLNTSNKVRISLYDGAFSATLPDHAKSAVHYFIRKQNITLAVSHGEIHSERLIAALLLDFQNVVGRWVEKTDWFTNRPAKHERDWSHANSGRMTRISQRDSDVGSQIFGLLSYNGTAEFGRDGYPRALGGSESFLKRIVGFKQNCGAYYRADEEKCGPCDKPSSETVNWLRLLKPPKSFWSRLLFFCFPGIASLIAGFVFLNGPHRRLEIGAVLYFGGMALIAIGAFLSAA